MEANCTVKINGTAYQCEAGLLVSTFLSRNSRALDLPCGGSGKCGKCRVIARGQLSPPSDQESKRLKPAELAQQIRLACQAKILGDCEISLLQADEMAQIAVEGYGALHFGRPLFARYGIAIDIGTTTIKMKLFNSTAELGVSSGRNPQIEFGADVITRIDKSLHGEAARIQAVIASYLNKMIAGLCHKCGVDKQQIDVLVITGNTTMLYLLTQENPDSLSHTPFIASRLFGEYVSPAEIGLDFSPEVKIYLARCMGAYVGGDISTALLASNITSRPQTALLVDIGTNGEMALWHQDKLFCCSTAAGPAFEGAEIALGMDAAEGAIDKIWHEEQDIRYKVIGRVPAKGICGSGVIDAASVFKELGIINEHGALQKEVVASLGRSREVDGTMACLISDQVYMTQKDVRMVQLAKSAICAGIYTLVEEAGISVDEVECLYLAGGFGNYLDIDSAANIGLVPSGFAAKTRVIGNAALQGAAQVLVNEDFSERKLLESLHVELLELGANKNFIDNYIEGMSF
jgi:uncharacterized 2Fe-2S/4Fe-4S cluster protein (DUF4445 family)